MKMMITLTLMFFLTPVVHGYGDIPKEAWDEINDPFVVSPDFQTQLDSLPAKGKSEFLPWSDSYWPSYQGGIAYRWNLKAPERKKLPFNYTPPSAEEIRTLSQDEISVLSPAEKFDIYMGYFRFPTYQREIKRTDRKAEAWEGICHGWAAATTNFPREPQAIVLKGPSGIAVPFGSSDIKALLSYYQGELSDAPSVTLGSRCESGRRGRNGLSRACKDVNAGAFHVVLTNMLGLRQTPFVADMTTGKEVWNFPVYSYESLVIRVKNKASVGAAPGTVKEVEFKTKVSYTIEADTDWGPTGGTLNKKEFHYRVEINANGDIIGGEWLEYERPDFLWIQERPEFVGHYKEIGKIYHSSLSER